MTSTSMLMSSSIATCCCNFRFFFMKIISTGQGQTPSFGTKWQWCCAMPAPAPAVAAKSLGRRGVSVGASWGLPVCSTHTCPRSPSSCSAVNASLTKILKCHFPSMYMFTRYVTSYLLAIELCGFENRGPLERGARHERRIQVMCC